jgi:hypothetical protein
MIYGSGFGPDFIGRSSVFNSTTSPIFAANKNAVFALVPNLPTGGATVTIQGATGSVTLAVSPLCLSRSLTPEDVKVRFVISEIIVFLKPGFTQLDLVGLKPTYHFSSIQFYPVLGFYVLRYERPRDATETLNLIHQLRQEFEVAYALPNYLHDPVQVNDPNLSQQNWLLALNLPQQWDRVFPKRGTGTTTSVADTGLDLALATTMKEYTLAAMTPKGINFSPGAENAPAANDDQGHGTGVATIIAAKANNAVNGAGVAPETHLVPLKVFALVGGGSHGTLEGVARTISASFMLGVDVMNLSLGCLGCPRSMELKMREFYRRVIDNLRNGARMDALAGETVKQTVMVAAAGNDGEGVVDSPAADPRVIAVGSLQADGRTRSRFSNNGPELAFTALGERVMTTLRGGSFGSIGSGTSFATPQVTGLAALILAEQPNLTPDQIKNKIRSCFVEELGPPGWDDQTGWGRIRIPVPVPSGC